MASIQSINAVQVVGLLYILFLFYMPTVIRSASLNAELEFKLRACDRQCYDEFISMEQHTVTGNIYVISKRGIYVLNSSLKQISHKETESKTELDSVNIKMILRRSDIVLCRNNSLTEGNCQLLDIKTLDTVAGYRHNIDINSHSVVWLGGDGADGNDSLNVAMSTKWLDSSSSVPFKMMATRILPVTRTENGSSNYFLRLMEDKNNIPSSMFVPSFCLSTQIDPMYGFSYGHYHYLIKRQTDNSGQIVAKLVRICKDQPTYRSYIELPIECIDKSETQLTEFSAAYFENNTLYTVFQKTDNNYNVVSSICEYNINDLDRSFQKRRKECLLGKTPSTELDWDRWNACPSKPIPTSVFNISRLDEPDFCYDLDIAQPLGGRQPIVGRTKVQIESVVITLSVSRNFEETTYLLGDKNGNLHKIEEGEYGVNEILEIDRNHDILASNGIILSQDKTTIFVITKRKIVGVPLQTVWSTMVPSTGAEIASPPKSFELKYIGLCVIIFFIIMAILGVLGYAIWRWSKSRNNEDKFKA